MSDATKRAIRTAYQILVALLTAAPVIVLALPGDVQTVPVVIAFGVWVGVVARAITALEDAGVIPAWLRDDPDAVPVYPDDEGHA